MKAAGIICEYNPFHLGHARQLQLTREQIGAETAIVCVMSGNYVQRGIPAMWDKYTRARAAVACGADLVLELPLTCVLQSAEGFAAGGVEVLTRSGVVSHISFGAECGNGQQLLELAQRSLTPECEERLRQYLSSGLSYAAARQSALGDTDGILDKPNNILGLEYCRAIVRSNSPLKPVVIHRNSDYHSMDTDTPAPSATAVRAQYPSGSWHSLVPPEAVAVLSDAPWYDTAYGERAVLARLRGLSNEEWEQAAHGSEGLWSKAMKAARSCGSTEAIIDAVKSKRYPRTRVQRLLLCAYLGIKQADLAVAPPYVRILATNNAGRTLLRQIRNHSDLYLINPGQTPQDTAYFRMDTRASDLYTLFAAPDFPTPAGAEQSARINF